MSNNTIPECSVLRRHYLSALQYQEAEAVPAAASAIEFKYILLGMLIMAGVLLIL